jgi:uncharacterized protein (TIGR02284 family)
MDNQESTYNLLRALILINNDRKSQFRWACTSLNDSDIKFYLESMIQQCEQFNHHLKFLGSEFNHSTLDTEGTTLSGKLYHLWMEIKSSISKMEIQTILENCSFCERTALKGYGVVLESLKSENATLINSVFVQYQKIEESIEKLALIKSNFYQEPK